MKKSLLIAATLCIAAYSAPASAQDSSIFGVDNTSGFNSLLAYSQIKHNSPGAIDPLSVRNRYIKQKGSGRAASGGSRSAPRGSTRSSGSTRFRPSLAARRANLARLVAKTRAVNPTEADTLRRTLGGSDPIASLKPSLSHYGLRADDVADATALYLVVAWYGVRGRSEDPPRAQVQGVRAQMRRMFLSVPAFASTSNADRQQLADAMLIQTIVAAGSINAAKINPVLMPRTKSAIRQGSMAAFKFDLTKMKLTNQGLKS